MPDLPTGTVTFLFTDIEGSTRLWELHPEAMEAALARHDLLAAGIISEHAGTLVKRRGEGDSLFAVFARAFDAVAAAGALQRALQTESWPAALPLRVRMALHTGAASTRDGDYYGAAVNRCARLRAIAHGGQVLLSETTCSEAADGLPEGIALRQLGAHRLKDLQQPEQIFQLIHPDLSTEFPPLRSFEASAESLPLEASSFIGQEREMADGRAVVVFLEGLAREAGVRGQPERAARLFGAAASLRDALGTPRPYAEREDYESHLIATGEQLGPELFAVVWTEGWSMTLEEAVAYAMAAPADTPAL